MTAGWRLVRGIPISTIPVPDSRQSGLTGGAPEKTLRRVSLGYLPDNTCIDQVQGPSLRRSQRVSVGPGPGGGTGSFSNNPQVGLRQQLELLEEDYRHPGSGHRVAQLGHPRQWRC